LFAFPLRLAGINVGAMDLYRAAPGSLSADELKGALMAAETAATALTGLDLEVGAEHSADDRADYDMRVHQATGMVMVQLGVPSQDALSTLRARAFSTGLPLTVLARDVVERRVRFAKEDQ
jgi:AmiR/NasT family two-component response regulator